MTQSCFDVSLEQYADATAFVLENGEIISYAELALKVDALSEKLKGRKQLIFILSGVNLPSIIAYLAGLRAGQAVALINGDLDAAGISSLAGKYQPEWIFEPVKQQHSYEYEEEGHGLKRTSQSCEKIINPDLALLLSTSGTTGSPKMVKLSKQNLYANAASIVEYLSIAQTDRSITSLPIHYSYGLSVLNTHLAAGAATVLTDKSMMTREFWDIFKKQKVTSFAGVPYHYEMLLRLRFFTMDLPHLKTLTQAGGKLASKYVQQFAHYAKERDIRFFVMYGQTEATARISYIPAKQIIENTHSIGDAIPGGQLYLQGSDGAVLEGNNMEGELVYEGPNVMMGYAHSRDDLAAADELCGRLMTGDIAKREQNGFFSITGRKKRFVKLFGNRVNLDEVEQLLQNNGFDALCGGEDNALLIVITDKSIQDDVKQCVVSSLGIHHSAIKTAVLDTFLRTASGKIDYRSTFLSLEYSTVN